MKKLLALFVVLVMASMANAAYLEITGSSSTGAGVLDWSVSGMELIGSAAAVPTGSYNGSVAILGTNATAIAPGRPGGTGMPTRPVTYDSVVYDVRNAGLGSINWYAPYSCWNLVADEGTAPVLRAAGEWFVFDIDLPVGTAFQVEVWDDANGYSEATDTLDIEVKDVPEPVTMTLLGLGGLALIRRRHA